ncbi:MAG: hypothetical protein H6751_11585 [Candidatus Omnitrophica bacterium]|nr:hypothetical protein [Candidatus Omnitrophota bacterium]
MMVEVAQKRNVAVVAHHGAGKTSLVEAILYMLGNVDRMGKTEDGNTFSDFTDEERDRKVSIHSSLIHAEYKNIVSTYWTCRGTPTSSER